MFKLIRSNNKLVFSILSTTLGVMWLSFAITPCLLAASIIGTPHDCCPEKTRAEYSDHMHDDCFSCDIIKPISRSANEYIHSPVTSNYDYDPVVITWDAHNLEDLEDSTSILVKFSYLASKTLSPPLRYRVLLI